MKRKVILFGFTLFNFPENIGEYEIISISPLKKLDIRKSLIRALYLRLGLSKVIQFFNVECLKQNLIEAEALIIVDAIPYYVINEIVKIVDESDAKLTHKIIYLWNPARNMLKLRLSDKWKIKGFDFNDCKKWGCEYVSTFHIPLNMEKLKPLYDIFFIGTNKGRFGIIRNIEREVSKLGLKCKFIYVSRLYRLIKSYSSPLPYREALVLMASSRAILDITQGGQMGLTQRFMESVFYEKKIITNNKEIKKYKAYNKNNIYILSEHNDYKSLAKFLSLPYEPLDEALVEWYGVECWLNRMLCDNNNTTDLLDGINTL